MATSDDTAPTPGDGSGRPRWTLLAASTLTNGSFELFEETAAHPAGPAPPPPRA